MKALIMAAIVVVAGGGLLLTSDDAAAIPPPCQTSLQNLEMECYHARTGGCVVFRPNGSEYCMP